MGKPKALRNKDVAPAIIKDQPLSRKRTNFDDVEELPLEDSRVNNDSLNADVGVSKLADEPEEVTANSIEVLRMKEMHEKIVESTLRRSKRRKVTSNKSSEQNADVALDQSIFDSLAHDDDESEDGEDDEEADTPSWKIDVKRSNSRKIGGVEVTVLGKEQELDPIQSFSVSESVKNFSAANYNKNARVKYLSFVTQKKGGPSKQFAVK